MENYANIDKNMVAEATIGDAQVVWYDVRKAPFSLYGLFNPESEEIFRRLPKEVAESVSEGAAALAENPAGGKVRFSTNSPYIAIRAKYRSVARFSLKNLVASAGFDLYVDGEFGSRYMKEFRPPYDLEDSYEQIIRLDGESMRSFTINFPTHSVVERLEVGLKPDAKVGEHSYPYRKKLPVVIYGSSIVHGTGASHPGMIYPSIISRELNLDVLNLGFSGKALGEEPMAEWISTLPMSVFVCDYDHNTPSHEHLEKTHYRFYEIVRKKNPSVPYVMITRPNFWTCSDAADEIMKRREVIMRSYLKARENGDKNVYFVDGFDFWVAPHTYDFSVDRLHPNDAGYIRMADSIGTLIRYILESK